MNRFSRLARRTAHLLTLEAFVLAVLVFPLQLARGSLESLREWILRPSWIPYLERWGFNPTSLWDYDISPILNSGFEPLIIKEGLLRAAVLLALVAFGLSLLTRRHASTSNPVTRIRLFWVVAVIAALTLSLARGTMGDDGTRLMVWLQSRSYFTALAGLAFLWLLADQVRCRRAAARWIALLYVVTAPIALISLLQHIGSQVLGEREYTFLGFIPVLRGEEFARNTVGSLIGHNVGASLMMVPGLCLLPGVWRRERRTLIRVALAAWAILAIWVIARAQSRSVALSIMLGTALFSILSLIRLRRRVSLIPSNARRWIMVAVVLFLITQVVPNPLRATGGFAQRFSRLVNVEDLMTDTRVRVFFCGVPAFRDRFLGGWGIGSFSYIYPYYQGRYFSNQDNWDTPLVPTNLLTQRAHNDWLQLAMEMGVMGLAVVIWGVTLWWRRGWVFARGRCGDDDLPLLWGVLLAGVIMILQAGFDFPMHVAPTALMALLLAVLAGNAPEIWGKARFAESPSPVKGAGRLVRWAMVVLVLVWCVWPPHIWKRPARSLNPQSMAPSLPLGLRTIVADVMTDARLVAAQEGALRPYYESPALHGTSEGLELLGQARARLRDAILINPSNGLAHHRMAETLVHLGQYNPDLCTAALDEFDIANDDVKNFTTFYFIAEAHHRLAMSRADEEITAREEGDTERADRLRAIHDLHLDRTILNFEEAIRYNPSDIYAADALAKIYLRRGMWRHAVGALRPVQHWNPQAYLERWEAETLTLIKLGEAERALERIQVMAEIEPNNPRYPAMAAKVYLRIGDTARASATVAAFHRNFPDVEGYEILDIELMVVEGDHEDALALIETIPPDERNDIIQNTEYLLLRHLGRFAEADAVNDQMMADYAERNLEPRVAAYQRGEIAWVLFNDQELAESLYRTSINNIPGPPSLPLHRMALRALERGDRTEAINLLQRLRSMERGYRPAEDLWDSLMEETEE